MRSIIVVAVLLSVGTAQGQGRYPYRGQVFKLMPFFTDYQKPDREFRSPRMRHLRSRVDLSGLQSAVKNQGSRGSCAYFAAMALCEHAAKRASGQDLNFSEEYLAYYTKAVLQQSSLKDGSYVGKNLKAINQGGLLLEEDMPYSYNWFLSGMPCENEDEDHCDLVECFAHREPSPEQLAQRILPAQFELQLSSNCAGSSCQDKLDWIIASLDSNRAVALSVPIHQDGWDGATGQASYTAEQAQVCEQDPDDSHCGGHAILLVGYDLEAGSFRFKNSWGDGWGLAGYGNIDFDYIDNYSRKYSIHRAGMIDLDPSIENNPGGGESVDNLEFQVEPGYLKDGEPGVLIRMTYEYPAPLGTFFYASAFVVRENAGSYSAVSFTDSDGKLQYVAARHYGIAFSQDDLVHTQDNPLELFLPYSLLDQAGLAPDENLFLRPSFYRMSDTESYVVLFRDYAPFTPEAPDPCQGETWEGRCDDQTVIWCQNDEIHTQDCLATGRTCVYDDQNQYFACR